MDVVFLFAERTFSRQTDSGGPDDVADIDFFQRDKMSRSRATLFVVRCSLFVRFMARCHFSCDGLSVYR